MRLCSLLDLVRPLPQRTGLHSLLWLGVVLVGRLYHNPFSWCLDALGLPASPAGCLKVFDQPGGAPEDLGHIPCVGLILVLVVADPRGGGAWVVIGWWVSSFPLFRGGF